MLDIGSNGEGGQQGWSLTGFAGIPGCIEGL